MINKESYIAISKELKDKNVTLVAVSKTKSVEDIQALYDLGQRDFGENYVQELVDKAAQLPTDICWHFIGHLQGNKVKYIAPFVQLIHGVDSLKLLKEIDKQGAKFNRVIDCLLQVYIADEETKFGMEENEVEEVLQAGPFPHARIVGLMAMWFAHKVDYRYYSKLSRYALWACIPLLIYDYNCLQEMTDIIYCLQNYLSPGSP